MNLDPLEKSIFIFCSRNRRRIAAIVWEWNGWLEITKKLDCSDGTYCWPKSEKEAEKVTLEDYSGDVERRQSLEAFFDNLNNIGLLNKVASLEETLSVSKGL